MSGVLCRLISLAVFFTFCMDFRTFIGLWLVFGVYWIKDMPGREEQRTNIKFLAQSGCNPTEVWHALKDVYGNNALSYPQVRLWHK